MSFVVCLDISNLNKRHTLHIRILDEKHIENQQMGVQIMEWTNVSLGISIEINEDDCSMCVDHTCISACDVLYYSYSNGHAMLRDAEECNGCGRCVNICPVEAMALISANNPHKPKMKQVIERGPLSGMRVVYPCLPR